jgi:hypothetical protein
MQQLLKALRGAARAEIVPTELLSQLLVAVDDPESAANLRLGRVSLSSAYLTARKEGRFSNSPWRAMSGLLSSAWPCGQGSVAEMGDSGWRVTAFGERLAFGRKERQAAVGPTEEAPTDASGVRTESRHQDFRDSWLAAPGQVHRPVAVGLQVSRR